MNLYTLHFTLCTLLFVLLAIAPGCQPKRQNTKPTPTAPDLFDQGLQYLQQKKYAKAAETFQRITFEYATTRYAADAQFYLAESYLGKKDYAQAEVEYEFLTNNYPTSPFYEEALYKTALCAFNESPKVTLDQTELRKTRDLLELFRERFPGSKWLPEIAKLDAEILTRLARKEYEAGLLYARAGEYESAKVYFLHVIENYAQASLIPEVRFQLAICHENTDAKDQARGIYQELSEGNYDPNLKRMAAERLAQMK